VRSSWSGRASLVGVIALTAPAAIQADPPLPPRWEGDAIEVRPITAKDLVRELRLGAFTARFEETPLEEISKELGGGAIAHAGDASESIGWFCSSLPGELIWFIGTEMSATQILDLVVVESVPDSDGRRERCAAVPAHRRPVSLEFGWIGTSEAELHSKLGTPSGVRGPWQLFYFEGKRKGTLPYRIPGASADSLVEFDVTAYVEAKLERGRVTSIRASHTTTY
jgi:hypothetical protein